MVHVLTHDAEPTPEPATSGTCMVVISWRNECARCRARAHGIQLSSGVSKATDCLVAGDGPPQGAPTRKYSTAQTNGIPIVEDAEDLGRLEDAVLEWTASNGA